ncbi:MAG: 3-hydroxybutyryl-CoA dehydrogenase [Methanobacteriota archaeon]|nr:MAG: 3-hydroxybutyryl-CoA dehydrogenase [Euryarchaeota archaeon]|tara:strand:- start:6018 stop:6869 length:852 start_codon:yes stop_codon:yes gene_type:complete
MSVESIAVIGSGQMGSGIAQVASLAGYSVILIDVKDEFLSKAISTIEFSLEKFVSKGKISEEESKNAKGLITTSVRMSDCSDVDLVIEAVPEIPQLKFNLFRELDEICKKTTILASNTSSISINELASKTNRPELVIGMHFMNPVPIMKLVEIIRGEKTNQRVCNIITEITEKMNKTALFCNDSPGFVSNRILCPMINEAILTLQEGVADPEAIDGIMKLGMNHPIGPLALADLIGLDTVLHIMNVLFDGLSNEKYSPAPLLIEMVEQGKLGRKSGVGFYVYS